MASCMHMKTIVKISTVAIIVYLLAFTYAASQRFAELQEANKMLASVIAASGLVTIDDTTGKPIVFNVSVLEAELGMLEKEYTRLNTIITE